MFARLASLLFTVTLISPATFAIAGTSTYLVTAPQGLPKTLEDKASGRTFSISADGKSVICTQAGKEIWKSKLLGDEPEVKIYLSDGTLYETKKNTVIGFVLNKGVLSVAIPGEGKSCWETLNSATGENTHSGGCD